MAIYNQIFEAHRAETKRIEKAIEFLQKKGYVVSEKKTYASDK